MTAGDVLTTEEVAGLLKVSIRQVQDMAAGSELPAYRIGGKRRGSWRFRKSEIDRWLSEQRNVPPQEPTIV